eukprot:COSAG01_NODE_2502_length_7556_cov_78.108220_5_plen_37_part_00
MKVLRLAHERTPSLFLTTLVEGAEWSGVFVTALMCM